MMSLSTPHLLLRPFEEEDAPALFTIHRQQKVRRFLPNESYESEEEALGAIRFFAGCVKAQKLPCVLAVTLEGQLIGDVGINEVEGEKNEVEIGFCISEAYANRGYATQAALAMEEYARQHFPISKLQGRVMQGNAASCRVLEKCGYLYCRTDLHAPDDPWGNGMLVYEKTL